jgi:uncharacterized protein YajQ (UPF0234 family)
MKAIAIIQDEHRAITAVVEGLRQLVTGISDEKAKEISKFVRQAVPKALRR